MKKLLLIGMGPGMGWALAKKFGSAGWEILMVARTVENLAGYQKDLEKLGAKSQAFGADLSKSADFGAVLAEIVSKNQVDGLLFNASVFNPGGPSQIHLPIFLSDFQVNVAAALQSIQAVLPKMKDRGAGLLFFTGGGSALEPTAYLTSLSIGKAGLRNLVFALADELKTTEIKVGTVTICGSIMAGTRFDPELIAGEFLRLAGLNKKDLAVETAWK